MAALCALCAACDAQPPSTPDATVLSPFVLPSVELPEARPGPPTRVPPYEVAALDKLGVTVGLTDLELEVPCVEPLQGACARTGLDRVFDRLDRLASKRDTGPVRLLLLGDSHIAADYIAKTARERLQAVFGDGGRGYVHGDQHNDYGGRKLSSGAGFTRKRMIDAGLGAGRYGFSGHALEASRKGAFLDYALAGDKKLTLFLDGRPGGGELALKADAATLGTASAEADPATTVARSFELPAGAKLLRLTAAGPGVALFGIDFLSGAPGLTLDAVGPVGADATTYVEADAISFESHVRALDPALVMLMLGGNDALRVRKGAATLDDTRARFDALVDRTKRGAPRADCLIFGPMDAGDRGPKGVVSKPLVGELRDLLREVAKKHGCAFWDLYAVMGGAGSITRWSKAGIMNDDLIHPRAKAGELLGYVFAEAFLRAYLEPH